MQWLDWEIRPWYTPVREPSAAWWRSATPTPRATSAVRESSPGDIARELGYSTDPCRVRQLDGMVHDIGKIGVPVEILSKPSRLTAVEYELVKTHVERGYEILKDVHFPWPIAESSASTTNAWTAAATRASCAPMTSCRKRVSSQSPTSWSRWRRIDHTGQALGLEAGIRELERHRGIKFDGDAVDALLRLIRGQQYELPR